MGSNAGARISATDCKTESGQHSVSYTGKVVQRAAPLTLEQVLPAVPLEDLSGKLNAAALCVGPMREMLTHPKRSLLPAAEVPLHLPSPKVRASQDEWNAIALERIRRNIFVVIEESRVHRHKGQLVPNGAFGVTKVKEMRSAKHQKMVPSLRPITNLTCSNALQRQIAGDVPMLPFFALWAGLEMLEDEILIWIAEDTRCAFHVFVLPAVWEPFSALEKPIVGHLVGA